jgi:hypothetical protein
MSDNPSPINYDEFRRTCCEDMTSLQHAFMKLYNIESYEHWFYDHGIGIFHFKSDDGRNLYFKYADVGTFSNVKKTWMWSWHNNSTPEKVKRRMNRVKEYGEVNGFELLTQGLIDGDEYTGWEFTTITAKLLNAIGMYRVPSGYLHAYFVFTGEVTHEVYEEMKKWQVTCDIHESGRASFVCQHLLRGEHKGFNETFDSDPSVEQEDDYQAWCDECEDLWMREKDWTDVFRAFVNLRIVCDECYFVIKGRNQLQ